MKELFNKKKGVVPLLISVPVAIVAAILVLVLVVAGFFALKTLMFYAIVGVLVGGGMFLSVQGNWQPGFALVIAGVFLFFAPQLGVMPLSWVQDGRNIVDIGVTHQNKLTYDISNTQPLKGALGVIAFFDGEEFIRADYFYTKTNGNRPEENIYGSRFNETIELSDYLLPGEHTIKVCREIATHRANENRYDIDDYWNMQKCGYSWESRSYNRATLDSDTKNFNKKWLPCSRTKPGNYNPIIPENVLGGADSFYYETLSDEEIDAFRGLTCKEFDVTIPGEPPITAEPVPEPKPEEASWWDKIVAFFANLKFGI